MLALKRIIKNYNIFLDLLKFSLKNADNPEFKDFSLISNYLLSLKDLEHNLRDVYSWDINDMELNYAELLELIFKDEEHDYKRYIDNDEKEELVRRFELMIDLADCSIDREGEIEVDIIDKEIREIKNRFLPLLKRLKYV